MVNDDWLVVPEVESLAQLVFRIVETSHGAIGYSLDDHDHRYNLVRTTFHCLVAYTLRGKVDNEVTHLWSTRSVDDQHSTVMFHV